MSWRDWPPPHFVDPVLQVVPGLAFNWPELTRALRWRSYWQGDLALLLSGRTGNDVNGLELLSGNLGDVMRLQYFRRFTDHLGDVLLSERPEFEGPGVYQSMLYEALRDVVVSLSVVGRAGLLWDGLEFQGLAGEWMAPVLTDDLRRLGGWLVFQPYYEGEVNALMLEPNRMRVVFSPLDGVGFDALFGYNGGVLGELLGSEERPALVIAAVSNGAGDYHLIEDVVRELMVRMALQSRVLNRHSSPDLQGPEPPGLGATTAGAVPMRRVFPYNPGGNYFPVGESEERYGYLTWDPGAQALDAHVARLIEELHLLSGMPPAVFGLAGRAGASGQRSTQSGVAEKVAMLPLLYRVRVYRRLLDDLVEEATIGAGRLVWRDDPLLDFSGGGD